MQQLVLDMGLGRVSTLANFCPGVNLQALDHLVRWLGEARVARSPHPTYLWGGNGCGKTHLLKAVQAGLQLQGQSAGWLDASGASVHEFDDRWSVVLLDDVHHFNASQQQMAFNWFINAQTQQIAVLATGSLPPADLKLRDDLRSRLGWGQVFGLQALGESERREVLQASAKSRGIALSDEVMDFMLTRFCRDLGSLMALLDQIDSYALQTRRSITIALIKTMLDSV